MHSTGIGLPSLSQRTCDPAAPQVEPHSICVGGYLQLGPPFLKMYVLMTLSGASDKSMQQMPDYVMRCYVTFPLCLCYRSVREYIHENNTCVACHAECQPLNGSASCRGPVRCFSTLCTVWSGITWRSPWKSEILIN